MGDAGRRRTCTDGPTPRCWSIRACCLVEGTELSEARGTTRPFELSGAPWLDGDKLADAMAAMDLPGCILRPAVYTPQFHKFAKQACGGVQIHVTNPETFRPYRTGVAFLKAAHDLDPEKFQWRTKAYEFVDKIPAIDLLAGNAALRTGIEAGASIDELCAPVAARRGRVPR